MNISPEYKCLDTYLQYLIKREGFSNECTVTVELCTKKGEGFMGQIYFVSLKENNKVLNVAVKSALQNEKVREIFEIKQIYTNETYFYSTIYPAMEKFEKKAKVTKPLSCVPLYYGCSMNEGTETLGLENLKLLGYEIFSKKLTFDDNHVKLVFENYGHLHGISFAYLDQHPEEFKELTKSIFIVNEVFADNHFFNKSINDVVDDALDKIKELNNTELLEKFKSYYDSCKKVLLNSTKPDKKYKPLLHGDCWSNNMMFKYEIKDGQKIPVHMKLLDFQLIVCSTPVNDLSYAFYSSASKEQFDKLDDFLQIYHKSLSKTITELGSDPTKLYPLSELREDWKQYAKFGYVMALILIRMKLTDADEIHDLNDLIDGLEKDNDVVPVSYKKEEFVKRVVDLTKHCYECGVL